MTGEPSSFDEQLAASVRADRLQLILLPTEQCNFRCTYCYEDFAIGRMTPEVVSGVKNLIDRRADGLSHLQLSWFGGEPTLDDMPGLTPRTYSWLDEALTAITSPDALRAADR